VKAFRDDVLIILEIANSVRVSALTKKGVWMVSFRLGFWLPVEDATSMWMQEHLKEAAAHAFQIFAQMTCKLVCWETCFFLCQYK
jgi:hypothetical protein